MQVKSTTQSVWYVTVMVRARDSKSRGCGLDLRPFYFYIITLGKLFTHVPLSPSSSATPPQAPYLHGPKLLKKSSIFIFQADDFLQHKAGLKGHACRLCQTKCFSNWPAHHYQISFQWPAHYMIGLQICCLSSHHTLLLFCTSLQPRAAKM